MDSLSTLLNQYQKPLVTIASFALVILMSVSLAKTALFVIEQVSQPAVNESNYRTASAPRAAAIDTSQIRNLFGVFQAREVAVQTQDVPETNLNLELQGIFTADNPEGSTAIVAQRGQSGQLYRIGDRLPGNATLQAVNPDHILIKRGARTEKLPFDDPSIGQGFSRTTNAEASNSSANQATLNSNGLGTNKVLTPSPEQAGISRLDQLNARISERKRIIEQQRGINQEPTQDLRSAISNFQDRLSTEPDAVLQELGVSESAGGFKIGSEVSASVLQQAGLQQGDVILSVNGQSAAGLAGDRTMVNQIMQSERARVEVQRGERKFVVTVPIPK